PTPADAPVTTTIFPMPCFISGGGVLETRNAGGLRLSLQEVVNEARRKVHRQAMSDRTPKGLRGDLARLFSERGLHEGRPSLPRAVERVVTRPGPLAIVLYRASHWLWIRGREVAAEILWRINYFLTGADIHPGAEIGGGLRLTHTTGLVIGRGVRIGDNVTILHGVTLGGSARGWFDRPSRTASRT